MQDFYTNRQMMTKRRFIYLSLPLFLILFFCYVAADFAQMNMATKTLFFFTLFIGSVGLLGGLLKSLGILLISLFVFGSILLWNQFGTPFLFFSVQEIIYWMSVLMIVAVTTGKFHQWVLTILTENKEMRARFDELVTIDETTGFDNRKRFLFELEEEYNRSKRTGLPFVLLMFKVNYFKEFQSLYGPKETIHLLQFVSDVMWKQTRMSDRKFRYEEDTFAILLTNTEIENIEIILHKLESKLKEHVLLNKKNQINLTISFGFSSYSEATNDYTEMIQHAKEELQQYVQ